VLRILRFSLLPRWYQELLKKCHFLLIFVKNQSLLLTFGEFLVLFGTFLPSFLAHKCNSLIISFFPIAPTTPFSKFSPKNPKNQSFQDNSYRLSSIVFCFLSPVFYSLSALPFTHDAIFTTPDGFIRCSLNAVRCFLFPNPY
jgi:hypothetical protein